MCACSRGINETTRYCTFLYCSRGNKRGFPSPCASALAFHECLLVSFDSMLQPVFRPLHLCEVLQQRSPLAGGLRPLGDEGMSGSSPFDTRAADAEASKHLAGKCYKTFQGMFGAKEGGTPGSCMQDTDMCKGCPNMPELSQLVGNSCVNSWRNAAWSHALHRVSDNDRPTQWTN